MSRSVIWAAIVGVSWGWGCAGKASPHHVDRNDAFGETKDPTTASGGTLGHAAGSLESTHATTGAEASHGSTSAVGHTLTTPDHTNGGHDSATAPTTSTRDEVATGKACGARAGDSCSKTEYCAYVPGQYCGQADAQATCKPRPESCTAAYDPVCGCDGKTHGNACSAALVGVGVFDKGECEDATPKSRECETIQCFRAITCAKSCTSEVVQAGCCPCPEGLIDTFVECPEGARER